MVTRPNVISSLIPMFDAGNEQDWEPVSGSRESLYDIKYVVIHTTWLIPIGNDSSGGTAQSNINYWKSAGSKGTSAHYIIDSGNIYQTVDDNSIAYHAGQGSYNRQSIGIELVATASVAGTISNDELLACAKLTSWLCQTYKIPIVHVTDSDNSSNSFMLPAGLIGHSQTSLSGKTDPGPHFDWNKFTSLVSGDSINHAPVLILNDVTVAANQSIAASSLIASAKDPDVGDTIEHYFFRDNGIGGGYFTVSGVVQAAGQFFSVAASNLSTVRYVGGSTAGSETIYVDASDGQVSASSAAAFVSLTATTTQGQTNHAPVITVHDAVVAANQSVTASSLITSATDPDPGDSITDYFFRDDGTGGGYFTVNGVAQTAGQFFSVAASNLSTVRYVGGSTAGSETIYVDASDGEVAGSSEGGVASLTATTTQAQTNHAPVITVHDAVVAANQSVAASSLITSATDPDAGDSITDYFFWDGSDGGGHFTVNGAVQAAGQWIGVTAADLNTVRYVGGSTAGSESLFIDVNDGEMAASSVAAMASLTATTTQTSAQTNHAPVIAVHDAVVAANQSVAASSLITSATDPDAGDSITDYFFWDGSDGGGHFTVNGAVQAAGQWIGVTAADLNTVRYVGGSTAGSESLFIDVNDGEIAASSVAAMASLTATTTQAQTNHAPVITVHDAVVAANQSVAASSLITSATDPDAGDSITDYFFWDGSDGGGYLTVNGAVQAAGQWIGVTAADLNTVHYVGGSAAGSETLYVDVNDGEIAASSGGAFASLIATTTRTEGKTIMWENVGDNFYNGSDGIDTIDYSRTTLGIRVDLSLSQAQSSGSEIGTDQLAAIENITGGTGNDFLVGNAAQNYFLGGGGNDSLDGGDGNDLLDGGPGNDLLKGGNGNDRMFGGINLDHLLGGAGNDSLSGGSGNDILNGGLGMDKLSGDLGRDIFVFDTALSASNVDTILKFSHTTDTIHLDDDIFKILNTGSVHSLSAGQFQKNASGLATQTDDRIVYNTSNGNLYYDPDGSGHVAAVRFATLSGHPTGIDHTDFLVVV